MVKANIDNLVQPLKALTNKRDTHNGKMFDIRIDQIVVTGDKVSFLYEGVEVVYLPVDYRPSDTLTINIEALLLGGLLVC